MLHQFSVGVAIIVLAWIACIAIRVIAETLAKELPRFILVTVPTTVLVMTAGLSFLMFLITLVKVCIGGYGPLLEGLVWMVGTAAVTVGSFILIEIVSKGPQSGLAVADH